MRLKLKKVLSGIILLHVVMFTWYLMIVQDTNTSPPGIQRFLAQERLVKVTSRIQKEASTSKNHQGTNKAVSDDRTGSAFLQAGGDCPNAKYPDALNLDEGWYPVDHVGNVYVFSAYHDERENNTVTIIGAKTTKHINLICQLWRRNSDGRYASIAESVATATTLPEGHGRRYTASVITCSVNRSPMPEAVSIVTSKCATPLNLLPVKRIVDRPYIRKFTVCLTPFNFRYGKAYELVEWMELNRILGAEHFTFYNYSSARNIRRVIDYYKGQGLVDVVNWNLPMGVDTWPRTSQPVEIHYFAQIAFLNECWRRNRQYSEYLVYVDLDEFIVPRDSNSSRWEEMLSKLPASPAYQFQNVFFRKEWDDPNLTFTSIDIAREFKLVTLLKTVREKQIMPYNMRSKYIVRSDSALILGIHNLPQLQKRRIPNRVPASIALLHHYRNWEKPDDGIARTTDITIVTKYKDSLIKRVKDVWSKFTGVEMDIPIV